VARERLADEPYEIFTRELTHILRCSPIFICFKPRRHISAVFQMTPVYSAINISSVWPPQQNVCSQYGGHCAFLAKNFSSSWVDRYAAQYFKGLHR